MTTGAEAEAKREAWVAQMANALVRVPYLKRTQLARIVGVNRTVIKRMVEQYDDVFEKVRYNRKEHGGVYDIRPNGVTHLIRLTNMAKRTWEKRSGIDSTGYVPKASVTRVVATGEVLTRMAEQGLYGWNWDVMVSQSSMDSVHAWLIAQHTENRTPIGLYILPHSEEKISNSKTVRGILHKVIQNKWANSLLLLVKEKYYDNVLRQMLHHKNRPTNLYLLPWEAFLYQPSYFLEGILDGDKETVDVSLALARPRQVMDVPLKYGASFARFIQHSNGDYQLMDIYVNGDVQRVENWIKRHPMDRAYFHDGQGVWGHIYVQNETMRDSLGKLFRQRNTMLHAESIRDLYPDLDFE